jgi:hypothetical protein
VGADAGAVAAGGVKTGRSAIEASGGGGGEGGDWGAADTDAPPAGTPVDAFPSRRTAKTALHTAQRARMPLSGTFAGSTRYVVLQLGQETFMGAPSPLVPGSRRRPEIGLRALSAIHHEY